MKFHDRELSVKIFIDKVGHAAFYDRRLLTAFQKYVAVLIVINVAPIFLIKYISDGSGWTA